MHVKRSVCDYGFTSKKRKARCTAVGEPENAVKRRKALLSEEELLVTKERERKSTKQVRELLKHNLILKIPYLLVQLNNLSLIT